jgi:succinate dehydrogenase / fumarate reductase cytochrome b subunit
MWELGFFSRISAHVLSGTVAPAATLQGPPTAKASSFFSSSIGKKVVMAVSGLVLYGFVIAHMAGNLQVYLGARAMNEYAEFLREVLHGAGIWIARAVLLLSVALHIWAATSLTLESWAARPLGYKRSARRESSYASRTMVLSGPILLFFILYHLAHFTTGQAHPNFIPGDVYHNFVVGFQSLPASIFYIVAMLFLGLHLYHGAWSMLQTLGLSHPRWNRLRFAAAALFTAAVVAGNISFPLAVQLGVLR